ncbi:RNA polymerase sigma-70 factor (sigma-E family) [Micromonospora kangleipakensis]|uniref:RNA polymerase sigma-70 factor (Sigma-E family) n=1 Tax=Micromonospora kangleipakensis TaxID=1077942 RepID=A0A4Q8B4A3_9ACTN|nr:SigE family RNA polymerase sigma factor [Micromonospora kangleipakensis]RZU71785.1 RNA polymerase sigma-70 factor (sigma-E family) [Micromonospora kangleipakensis]
MAAPTGPAGFAEFVNARYAALVRHGTLLTGDRGHGEDLTQEALVKTYRAWSRLHPDGDADGYTRQVMVRAAWRAGRRLWRREIPTGELPERRDADPYEPRDTARLVLDALRALPAQQRVVLVMRYWAGLSEQEISVQLGCSTGTVKSRASRAIGALRRTDGPLAQAFELSETSA